MIWIWFKVTVCLRETEFIWIYCTGFVSLLVSKVTTTSQNNVFLFQVEIIFGCILDVIILSQITIFNLLNPCSLLMMSISLIYSFILSAIIKIICRSISFLHYVQLKYICNTEQTLPTKVREHIDFFSSKHKKIDQVSCS